jgi:hypothetical protein
MRITIAMGVLVLLFVSAPASVGYADQAPDGRTVDSGADANAGGDTVLAQFGGRFRIYVTSATYGGNCGVPRGNVTYALAEACNGRRVCEYVVHHRILGDPARGCPKDFVVRWQCGDGEPHRAGAPPEAGFGSVVVLSCRD